MQGARNGPQIDEDPVGPRYWVAGGPMAYKHGMRDGMRGRDREKSVARAEREPLQNGKTAGRGDWAGDWTRQRGKGHRGMANETEQGKMAEGAKQQPRGIGKPVAMGW